MSYLLIYGRPEFPANFPNFHNQKVFQLSPNFSLCMHEPEIWGRILALKNIGCIFFTMRTVTFNTDWCQKFVAGESNL